MTEEFCSDSNYILCVDKPRGQVAVTFLIVMVILFVIFWLFLLVRFLRKRRKTIVYHWREKDAKDEKRQKQLEKETKAKKKRELLESYEPPRSKTEAKVDE